MRSCNKALFCAICLALSANAFAIDKGRYTGIVKDTIQKVLSDSKPDIDALIAQQEELIALGIEGCKEYIQSNAVAEPLLTLVVANAGDMQNLSLEQIEEQWHDYGFPQAHGVDPEEFDHFGPEVSLMDSVIHPATAIIALREYKKTGDQAYLLQVKDELSEVTEHLKNIP